MMDQQLSSHHALGSLQKTYRDQGVWIVFLVFVLITIFSLVVLLDSLDSIWYFAFLIPMVLLFMLVLVWALHRDRISLRICVYEGGLVYQNRHENKVILWSDIRYIRHKAVVSYTSYSVNMEHTYVFRSRDGETLLTLEFDGTWERQKRRIAEMIEQAASAMLYPPALAAYQQGQDCLFGDITLSLWGVSYGGKLTPWHEVKAFTMLLQTIHIKRFGDSRLKWWFQQVPLWRVDNVEVMRKLIEVAASTHHFKIQNWHSSSNRTFCGVPPVRGSMLSGSPSQAYLNICQRQT